MPWHFSAPGTVPSLAFTSAGGADVACTLRLRGSAPPAEARELAEDMLLRLRVPVCERMAGHPHIWRHADVGVERAELERQLADRLAELERLTVLRQSIVCQARSRWLQRSRELDAEIAVLEMDIADLQASVSACDEALAAGMARRDAAAERIAGMELAELIAEVDSERQRAMDELERLASPFLDRLRALDARRRDFGNAAGLRKALVRAGLERAEAEALERWKQGKAARELAEEKNHEQESVPRAS